VSECCSRHATVCRPLLASSTLITSITFPGHDKFLCVLRSAGALAGHGRWHECLACGEADDRSALHVVPPPLLVAHGQQSRLASTPSPPGAPPSAYAMLLRRAKKHIALNHMKCLLIAILLYAAIVSASTLAALSHGAPFDDANFLTPLDCGASCVRSRLPLLSLR
jgi:hypothetical protein